MEKKLTLVLLAIIVVSTTLIPMSTLFASTSITVDCSSTIREVTHCASGSLYGVTESIPSDITNLVKPLNPHVFTQPAKAGSGYQQPIGEAVPVANRLQNTTGKVMIRLADICPNWPYSFPGMTSWLQQVTDVINNKKASGLSNIYGYEIWNEPCYTWDWNTESFWELWSQTYNLIRELDPGAKIIGPSEGYYSHDMMYDFLGYVSATNTVPDIICWHELSGEGGSVGNFTSHMNDYRNLEEQFGISDLPVSINEYCDEDHYKEGAPGPSSVFIAKFERHKIDSACISWWWTAYPGRLGSLLASDTTKGGGWWLYYWYGQMTGNMVNVTPPNDASKQVDGFACVDSSKQYISAVFGGENDGTIKAKFTNLPSFIGSYANVVVEKTTWTNKDTTVNSTNTISQGTYTVSNNSISVSISGCNNLEGYRVYITSGTSSGSGTEIVSGQYYNLLNANSGKVLGVDGMSTDDGAAVLQWSDNGTADHNWKLDLQSSGYYKITNQNSGKVLGIADMSQDNGAQAIQWTDNGTADHDWSFVSLSNGNYKIVNRNSSKVLGIDGMGTEDGALCVQWEDNGTLDHEWSLEAAD